MEDQKREKKTIGEEAILDVNVKRNGGKEAGMRKKAWCMELVKLPIR